MKLYHGSPTKLKTIKPKQARGLNKFENKKAVFLTKTFKHAALYAIGKTLKGKAIFGVIPNKLIIVGNKKPKSGYVFEVEIESPIKGPRNQFASKKQLIPKNSKKVYPKDYKIIFVQNKTELMRELK
ncbi:hypothetical protein CMI44_01510 [Candidatus Pacearchaeota archaeon]|nr:hypothetical protein [Candidatus Pacearchaeota archaeon]|tara:strand:+ start:2568 stop:2948 length:381 start_codon:yes stop_codon:yes gene_type:complete